jgi:tRNA(Glu) U13 pseudouridine synthase TruD
MFVRDVCVAQAPLRLGDLSGNFFAITLRKEEGSNTQNSLTILGQPSASTLLSSFAAVASYPFMNIFGVQRFGSPLPSNPEVGMRLLASDYRGKHARTFVPFLVLVLVFHHIHFFSSFCTFALCLKIKLHRVTLSWE